MEKKNANQIFYDSYPGRGAINGRFDIGLLSPPQVELVSQLECFLCQSIQRNKNLGKIKAQHKAGTRTHLFCHSQPALTFSNEKPYFSLNMMDRQNG